MMIFADKNPIFADKNMAFVYFMHFQCNVL